MPHPNDEPELPEGDQAANGLSPDVEMVRTENENPDLDLALAVAFRDSVDSANHPTRIGPSIPPGTVIAGKYES